jgi:hypothetical protein
MGVTCGCVREPGSLTLPFVVGFLFFSTKSKKTETPPEWFGMPLRAFLAVRKATHSTVKSVAGLNLHKNAPFVGGVGFSTSSKNLHPPLQSDWRQSRQPASGHVSA